MKRKGFCAGSDAIFSTSVWEQHWPARDSTKLANLHAFVLFSQDEKED